MQLPGACSEHSRPPSDTVAQTAVTFWNVLTTGPRNPHVVPPQPSRASTILAMRDVGYLSDAPFLPRTLSR